MGREAKCRCTWGEITAQCSVLLESRELIVRGPIRRHVSISLLMDVAVKADSLVFRVEEEQVSLALGADMASRWAKVMAAPPPSLAKKLGISGASRVLVIGEAEAHELRDAIAEAGSIGGKDPNLIVICADSQSELASALTARSGDSEDAPVWVVYRKGQKTFGGNDIRDALRNHGFIDTKVASVSAAFTGLRFVRRIGS
jgi:hypothetical protein